MCLDSWNKRNRPADMELHGGVFGNIERHIVSSCISADVVHDVLEYRWLRGGDRTGFTSYDVINILPSFRSRGGNLVDHHQENNGPNLGVLGNSRMWVSSLRMLLQLSRTVAFQMGSHLPSSQLSKAGRGS